MTGVEQGSGVISPAILVEVRGKEPACLILQQWIYPCDKVTRVGFAATQMFFDDVTGGWDECLMRALSAFHLRLAANPLCPFVRACWGISGTAGPPAFPIGQERHRDVRQTNGGITRFFWPMKSCW